jgi:hypothetical protein
LSGGTMNEDNHDQMDASNSEISTVSTLKLAIKTPKEKKDISIDGSSTVKQVISIRNFFF